MNGELWIWTELLAFDNTQPDFGVQAYLEHIQTVPTGISLLSGYDLILYHENLNKEELMPPSVCSRGGHYSNGMRERQDWTNFQIRDLVKELRKHGIKVLISVFETGAKFSKQNCPEQRYPFIGKLNDGRSAGEYFIAQMDKIMKDYGFDGWHAADNIAAGWSILNYPTDHVIRDFAETHRGLGLPAFMFEDASAPENDPKRLLKLQFLQKYCWKVWNDYMLELWMNFWEKAVGMVHAQGKILMVNSPNTKSIFGALQYMNVDYRKLAKLGIDYLLCETTAPSCQLIWHTRPFVHEFNAVLSEMTASMPGVKILIMPAVKDIVETYDALEHAPCLYERDLNMQTAQHVLRNGKLDRCADGLIVCLGDCIERHEWTMLNELYERAFSFKANKTGELVWLHDSAMFDTLQEEHHKLGTWSPSQQINELRNLRSIDISTIADVAELKHITRPVIAFDFHLWSKEKQSAVLASKLPMILTGTFEEKDLPPDAEMIRWRNCCCLFLNWKGLMPGVTEIPPGPQLRPFDDTKSFSLYREFYPHREMPAEFWKKIADRIRLLLGKLPLQNEHDGIQMTCQYAADGSELIMLTSWQNYYTIPIYKMPAAPKEISVLSRFPKVPLGVRDGLLWIGDPVRQTPLHLPPMGVLSFVKKS